jgi:hypothetical protein
MAPLTGTLERTVGATDPGGRSVEEVSPQAMDKERSMNAAAPPRRCDLRFIM